LLDATESVGHLDSRGIEPALGRLWLCVQRKGQQKSERCDDRQFIHWMHQFVPRVSGFRQSPTSPLARSGTLACASGSVAVTPAATSLAKK
jgi:hypothetical protein